MPRDRSRIVNGINFQRGTYARRASLPGVDLSNLDLRQSDLRSIVLTGANLSGSDLSHSILCHADFSGANLSHVNFTGSDLTGANLDNANLTGANFEGSSRYSMTRRGANCTDVIFPCDHCNHIECECYHCNCGQRVDSICLRCDQGRDCCCECLSCRNCGDPCDGSDYCENCDRCSGCCHCEDESRFREMQPCQIWRAPKGQSQRLAGIEYETIQVPTQAGYTWAQKWGAGWHEDGSCGFEAVTPPASGSNIDKCLTELGRVIGQTDKRCGIHVHVDASDYTWQDLYRFLRVYAKLEPLLYVIGGQQRLQNSYCEPCGQTYLDALKTEDPKNAVLSVAYGVPMRQNQGKEANRYSPTKKMSGRYKGVNIAPWIYGRRVTRRKRADTTFEFRLHRNGESAERVIGWTHLCVALVEWCQRASDTDVKKLPKSALRALHQIAPKSKAYILARIKEWREHTKVGSSAPRRVDSRTWTIKNNPQLRIAVRNRVPPTAAPIPVASNRRPAPIDPLFVYPTSDANYRQNCDCRSCEAARLAEETTILERAL